MLITLLATALVLGVLIFVHELGHFMTAKWADIEVPRFSIGFGPRILGFRRGETEYVISLLPLGGYVKMAGMEEMEPIEGGTSAEPHSPSTEGSVAVRTRGARDFESKSLPWRALVISAGVIMNLLFAFVVFSFIAMVYGVPEDPAPVVGDVTEDLLPAGTEALARLERGARIESVGGRSIPNFSTLRIELSTARPGPLEIGVAGAGPIHITVPDRDSLRTNLVLAIQPEMISEPVISQVSAGEPAEAAGLQSGDRVVSVDGVRVDSWQELVNRVEDSPGSPITITVRRGGEEVETQVIPRAARLADGFEYGRIGVAGTAGLLVAPRDRKGPLEAVLHGGLETGRWVRLTGEFLVGLFSGRHSARDLGGPILIGQLSGEVARAGLESLLSFMGLLSVNLAILNLLPIPVLDGGHLVFLAIEAVRGRALSIQQRIRLTQVGFVMILAIMVFAIGNDLLRLIGR
jgi:regulator of sigma E protease